MGITFQMRFSFSCFFAFLVSLPFFPNTSYYLIVPIYEDRDRALRNQFDR